jgi:5-deoxy-glucuronate isomerase
MLSEKEEMESWRIQSPEEPGFHPVVTPEDCACQETRVYRLNLPAGERYRLESGELEMHPVLIEGTACLSGHSELSQHMKQFDAFYIPGNDTVTICAETDCVFYIAAAVYEGYGKPFFRAFDKDAPVGDIHQIHGEGIGQREVFMTLSDKDEASRLICGLTWGGEGAWTSWPPHQHEKDLEEVYCYFGMPLPHFGFHISYLRSGEVDGIVTHTVHSGTMVQAPRGYHPTVASPGTRNSYLWVLGALRHSSRRYDLAILDPALREFNSAR